MSRSFALKDIQFKRRDKREAMAEYSRVSGDLSSALNKKEITQSEFEERHDQLDQKYRWLFY